MENNIASAQIIEGQTLMCESGWGSFSVTVVRVTPTRITVKLPSGKRQEFLRDGREILWETPGYSAMDGWQLYLT
jgi:hypothetical protein